MFTVVSALALLATALLLALLVGSKGTCFAVCGGYVTAQGWPQGYVFFSVPAGLLVAVLVVAEVLLFVLLSRMAPKRKFDDDWDDEFIELDPHAGKVPI
jgi:TRAP-type C4-dicarboxylate transport system permease small subunit